MSQSFRLRFLLLALPFILALALLAAVQPVTSVASAVPYHAFGRHMPHGRGQPFGGSARRYGPGAWRGAGAGRPPAPVPPVTGFTVDGGRLLAALALSGAFTGLLWLTPDGREPTPLPAPGETALEQDVVLLRAEVERLQREQRQLQWTLDWQERLLTEGRRSEDGPTT
jgi:hypothetical protein